MIDGEDEICLTPNKRYSKIPNIYFIPTISALKNWVERAGFENFEVLATTVTTSEEQRKTDWSFDQSLEDFFLVLECFYVSILKKTFQNYISTLIDK